MNKATKECFIVFGFLVAFMVFLTPVSTLAQGTDLVPDRKLAEDLSDELGIPVEEITLYHLLNLTALEASNVRNFTGLLYAENLERLDLDQLDHFANLEMIFELEELEELSISNSRLRDAAFEEVSQLVDLEVLRLEGNGIKELPAFDGLNGLQILSLQNNEIVNIDELKKLRSIEVLDLSDNHIKDVTPLMKLHELHKLDLSGNRITDVSPLLKNVGLEEGDIVMLQNNFLDFSPGCRDHKNVKALRSRGIKVTCLPQRTQKRKASASEGTD